MNDTLPIILSLAAVAALVIFLLMRKKAKKTDIVTERLQAEIDKLTGRTTTPLGVVILSDSPRSEQFIAAVDAGFRLYQKIAEQEGYKNYPAPEHFTVLVFPAVTETDSSGNYSPSFKVFLSPTDPYNGSVYDKGGYVWAAEQVIGLDDGIFAVAENNNFEYCKNATYNGLEHLLLWYCDRQRFEATKDHSQTGGHPIITDKTPA